MSTLLQHTVWPGSIALSAEAEGAAGPELAPEQMRERVQRGKALAAGVGSIVMLLMRSPPYRTLPVSELTSIVLPPVMLGQFATAEAVTKEAEIAQPVAALIWARVSDAVDQRLATTQDMILRLNPDEWRSGDHLWIVEALGDRRALAGLFGRVSSNDWKGGDARIRMRGSDGQITVTTVQSLLSRAPAST